MIRILPDTLVNQIAACEVVERPAAVVKELIENSLAADARAIEIETEQSGAALIRIRDDGKGVAPEQLALALTQSGKAARRERVCRREATSGGRGDFKKQDTHKVW